MSKRSEKLFANKDNVRVPRVPGVPEAPEVSGGEAQFTDVEKETLIQLTERRVKEITNPDKTAILYDRSRSKATSTISDYLDELSKKYGERETARALYELTRPYHNQILS